MNLAIIIIFILLILIYFLFSIPGLVGYWGDVDYAINDVMSSQCFQLSKVPQCF